MPIIIFFKINELILLQLGIVKLSDNLYSMCDGVHTNNSFNNNDLAIFRILFQKCKEYRHFYTFVIAELIKISKWSKCVFRKKLQNILHLDIFELDLGRNAEVLSVYLIIPLRSASGRSRKIINAPISGH